MMLCFEKIAKVLVKQGCYQMKQQCRVKIKAFKRKYREFLEKLLADDALLLLKRLFCHTLSHKSPNTRTSTPL